jgi:excisionase family DNA binding protein
VTTITLETSLTEEDVQNATEAYQRLAMGRELMPLTPSVVRILTQVLESIANGESRRNTTKLSTTEAAKYLNVSRPYLYKLLDEGKIACHRVGSHRRLYLTDLDAYKERQEASAYAALQALQDQAQDLNMGY